MKLRFITLCLLLIGMVIFAYSLSLPYYKNNKGPESVTLHTSATDDYEKFKEEYYKYEETYRTNKTDLMDLGAGICVASLSFLAFLLITKTRRFPDFKDISTPGRAGIFLGTNIMWLLTIPGTHWYYTVRAIREDYPPFSDSIGIPISIQVPVCFLLLVPLNIFIVLCIATAKLPAQLIRVPHHYDGARITVEVFFGFLMLINLVCLVSEIIDGDHFMIVVSMYFIYAFLSLRTGIVNRYASSSSTPTPEAL